MDLHIIRQNFLELVAKCQNIFKNEGKKLRTTLMNLVANLPNQSIQAATRTIPENSSHDLKIQEYLDFIDLINNNSDDIEDTSNFSDNLMNHINEYNILNSIVNNEIITISLNKLYGFNLETCNEMIEVLKKHSSLLSMMTFILINQNPEVFTEYCKKEEGINKIIEIWAQIREEQKKRIFDFIKLDISQIKSDIKEENDRISKNI